MSKKKYGRSLRKGFRTSFAIFLNIYENYFCELLNYSGEMLQKVYIKSRTRLKK
jgi:hypothetical protein